MSRARPTRWPNRTRSTSTAQPSTCIHFDLYRMASPEEFLDAGFREHFNGDSDLHRRMAGKSRAGVAAARH